MTTSSSSRARIARTLLFSSAHFYAQPLFTREENLEHFGACYTEHGHGHNYVLEVVLEGPIDPRTKMVLNLVDLDRLLKTVVAPLDHHHLNFDVPEFRDTDPRDGSVKVPTTENLALHLRERFLSEWGKDPELARLQVTLKRIRLYETEDLWVEVE